MPQSLKVHGALEVIEPNKGKISTKSVGLIARHSICFAHFAGKRPRNSLLFKGL